MAVRSSQDADIASRFEKLLTETGAKDRANIDRHLAACDAETDPQHGMLWRRLFVALRGLAPIIAIGSHAVRFFIADGKYRMQVFAIEDNRDGMLAVYLPNVMAKAVREKLIVKKNEAYSIGGSNRPLRIQAVDASGDPPEHVKHMTGWNRKAVKSTLLMSDADGPLVDATERLCALAAEEWAGSSKGL